VDGWQALHERFARLPLLDLLEPARAHAANGFSASEAVAAAAPLLAGVAHADDFTAGGRLVAGRIVRRPGVAGAPEAIARDGRRGFHEGEFGDADWVQPLAIDAFGSGSGRRLRAHRAT